MKKKLSFLPVLVLIISLVFALSSCGETTGTDTNTTVDKESNSETESIEKETATDNKTETETEDSTDTETESENETETSTESETETEHEHVEEIIPAVKPTCNKVGNTAGKKCAICDAILEEPIIISTLGHTSAVLPRKEPTCTENGLTEGLKCSICDEILFEQEEIPMLEHEYIANDSKKATCTEIGWNAYISCSFCEYTTFKKIPALGHDMQKSQTVDPTCQTKGYDLYTCSRNCGAEPEKRNEFPTSITGLSQYHKYVEDANATAATCTEAGFSQMICEYCDATKDRKTLPALGHTFERTYGENETDPTEVINVAPQCEVNGQITYKCADCDEVKVITYESLTGEGATEEDLALAETLKALEHEFTVENEKVEPTCLTAGYLIMECANGCKQTKKVADYEPLGHTYTREGVTELSYVEKLAPTCITPGKEWAKCDDCGYCAFDDEVPNVDYSREVPATGNHVYDIKNGGKLANCCEEGYTIYRCSADANCVEEEKRDIQEKFPHDWVLDTDQLQLVDGKWVATCLTNGDYPYYCQNKNNAKIRCTATSVNEGGEDVSEIRHTFVPGEYASAPTCIKNAFYQCTTCTTLFEAYDDDEGAQATGIHIYNEESITTIVDSTCSTYGYTIYKCSVDDDCQETECKDYTVRKPHEFTDNTDECYICQQSFVNIASKVERLCDSSCTGTGCSIHDIFTITNFDDLMVEEISANIPLEKHLTREKVALIELIGKLNTIYEIELFDYEGNIIESFIANINGSDIELDINFETSVQANGKKYIDITEVENIVSTIVITASTDAKVNFYCRYSNIDSLI